ncbi:sialoadhesin-like, partial [Silurus asotus]
FYFFIIIICLTRFGIFSVTERPQAVLSVSPQNWLTEGDSVTLSCEVTDSSTDWTFSWYTVVPYRDGVTAVINSHGHIMYVELLLDSSRGSGGSYTLSPSALHHTGVYVCRGERGKPAIYTKYSNPQPLWISGESSPFSMINNPRRTHHFTRDSLSLSCEDQSNSTGWTVRRYTDSEGVLDCSHWGSVTGSTCNISSLSTSYTGVYWCVSESGENSNPVVIKVHGSPKAVLSIRPDSHVLIEERVVLKCEVQGRRGVQWIYSWYKNNNRLSEEEDGGYTFRPIMGLLIIPFVSESDSGDYTCRGQRRDSWKSGISDAVTLTVLGRPKPVASINPDKPVFSGDTVTLRCEIQDESVSRWQYSWYKDASLSPVSSVQMYRISSVEVTHTGNYTCKGKESGGSRSSHLSDAVTLTVSARPKPVASINPDKQVFSGDTVTLRCEIQDESVSRWQYSWYKDASLSPVSSVQMYTISSVEVTHTGNYTCKGRESGGSRSSHLSDAVTLTVSERPQAVLSVSSQNWLTEGDSVTLSCEVTDSSTDWTFSWYTVVPYRDGVTAIKNIRGFIMYVELLSDSSRGSGGSYTLSPSALHHTGVYVCRGEKGEPVSHTLYSNPQSLWITGESPPVSLIISPSRTQHFTRDSLSLSCEDQSNSTGWTVRRYTDSEGVLDCSQWGSVTGSTCNISFLSTSYTGVYWCESESGENSNPVNITVQGESLCSVFIVNRKVKSLI